ncbi:hypothetical protein Aph01nite_14530 [Acrocarpospora phusangensis]|uniref:TIR domain-containing protein n=2 Tax=Acrocarpospora phusangensis TaxID=1070424 RepID=A0A919Q952_9ACTN|nr:hypothetical protein Aph01nite_14530 [Acrocarpospora phusangensis]
MALANCAWILASRGHRVLCVDFDTESPGLLHYFEPFLGQWSASASGVIELFTGYEHAAKDGRDLDALIARHADAASLVLPVSWGHFPEGGSLGLIPAGRQRREYSAQLSGFGWDKFFDGLKGTQFIKALRANFKRDYDYVLIDSKTGRGEISDVCAVDFPDTLVVCFTLNDQSIDGASELAREISDRYRHIEILPVPMRIEEGEKEKADNGRTYARNRFSRFPVGLPAEQTRRYWGSVEIPHRSFYAFEEILATFGDGPDVHSSLLAAYERLTGAITGGAVTALGVPWIAGRPMTAEEAEALRIRHRWVFNRKRINPGTTVYLSHVPEDRAWAEWIQFLLSRFGLYVIPRCSGVENDEEIERAVKDADHIVEVVSRSYLDAQGSRRVRGTAAAEDPVGAGRLLKRVLVGEIGQVAPMVAEDLVDLTGLTPEEAVHTLLGVFGRSATSTQIEEALRSGPRFPVPGPLS